MVLLHLRSSVEPCISLSVSGVPIAGGAQALAFHPGLQPVKAVMPAPPADTRGVFCSLLCLLLVRGLQADVLSCGGQGALLGPPGSC